MSLPKMVEKPPDDEKPPADEAHVRFMARAESLKRQTTPQDSPLEMESVSHDEAHGSMMMPPEPPSLLPEAEETTGLVMAAAADEQVLRATAAQLCSCGNTFMDDSQFCRKCGQPRHGPAKEAAVRLPSKDPALCSCGNTYMGDSQFCRKCGQPRPQAQQVVAQHMPTPVGPRKSQYSNCTRKSQIRKEHMPSKENIRHCQIPGDKAMMYQYSTPGKNTDSVIFFVIALCMFMYEGNPHMQETPTLYAANRSVYNGTEFENGFDIVMLNMNEQAHRNKRNALYDPLDEGTFENAVLECKYGFPQATFGPYKIAGYWCPIVLQQGPMEHTVQWYIVFCVIMLWLQFKGRKLQRKALVQKKEESKGAELIREKSGAKFAILDALEAEVLGYRPGHMHLWVMSMTFCFVFAVLAKVYGKTGTNPVSCMRYGNWTGHWDKCIAAGAGDTAILCFLPASIMFAWCFAIYDGRAAISDSDYTHYLATLTDEDAKPEMNILEKLAFDMKILVRSQVQDELLRAFTPGIDLHPKVYLRKFFPKVSLRLFGTDSNAKEPMVEDPKNLRLDQSKKSLGDKVEAGGLTKGDEVHDWNDTFKSGMDGFGIDVEMLDKAVMGADNPYSKKMAASAAAAAAAAGTDDTYCTPAEAAAKRYHNAQKIRGNVDVVTNITTLISADDADEEAELSLRTYLSVQPTTILGFAIGVFTCCVQLANPIGSSRPARVLDGSLHQLCEITSSSFDNVWCSGQSLGWRTIAGAYNSNEIKNTLFQNASTMLFVIIGIKAIAMMLLGGLFFIFVHTTVTGVRVAGLPMEIMGNILSKWILDGDVNNLQLKAWLMARNSFLHNEIRLTLARYEKGVVGCIFLCLALVTTELYDVLINNQAPMFLRCSAIGLFSFAVLATMGRALTCHLAQKKHRQLLDTLAQSIAVKADKHSAELMLVNTIEGVIKNLAKTDYQTKLAMIPLNPKIFKVIKGYLVTASSMIIAKYMSDTGEQANPVPEA